MKYYYYMDSLDNPKHKLGECSSAKKAVIRLICTFNADSIRAFSVAYICDDSDAVRAVLHRSDSNHLVFSVI